MASLVPPEEQVGFNSDSVWGCEEHHLSTSHACCSGPFDEPASPMDSELRRIRRERAFAGTMHATQLTQRIRAGQPQGVPQETLDVLSIGDAGHEHVTDTSEYNEDALIRVRRARAFIGSSEAAIIVAELRSKAARDAIGLSGSSHTSACSSNRASGRSSLASVPCNLRGEDPLKDAEKSEEPTSIAIALEDTNRGVGCDHVRPGEHDDVLYRLRRVRFFLGAERALALAAAATAADAAADKAVVENISSGKCTSTCGKSQWELDGLCVEAPPEEVCSVFCGSGSTAIQVELMATPQRKRRPSRRPSCNLESGAEESRCTA